jgi:hypothetical protein
MPRAVTFEPTPNPNALRFSLGEAVLGERSRSFAGAAEARGTPWVAQLFTIPGVRTVFAVRDFVTVTKDAHAEWETIVPHVVGVLQGAEF